MAFSTPFLLLSNLKSESTFVPRKFRTLYSNACRLFVLTLHKLQFNRSLYCFVVTPAQTITVRPFFEPCALLFCFVLLGADICSVHSIRVIRRVYIVHLFTYLNVYGSFFSLTLALSPCCCFSRRMN